MPHLATIVVPYIALGVVVVGWFVTNRQANAREDRKEARSLVDGAKKLAIEVAEESMSYMGSETSDAAVAIKSTLEALEVELQRIPEFASLDSLLMRALTAFQDAVTGGDFETAHRTKRGPQSPEVAAVLRTRNALLSALEKRYRDTYCS